MGTWVGRADRAGGPPYRFFRYLRRRKATTKPGRAHAASARVAGSGTSLAGVGVASTDAPMMPGMTETGLKYGPIVTVYWLSPSTSCRVVGVVKLLERFVL